MVMNLMLVRGVLLHDTADRIRPTISIRKVKRDECTVTRRNLPILARGSDSLDFSSEAAF